MKAILTFDCNDPHESLEFKRASSADQSYLSLFNIREYLFKQINGEDICESYKPIFISVLEKFNDILSEHNIDLDNLD